MSPPRDRRGFVLFFTGLSGSGKTTISEALITKLQSIMPTRKITVLDGDVVRTFLSKGLGFTVQVSFVEPELAALCSEPPFYSRTVTSMLSALALLPQKSLSTMALLCVVPFPPLSLVAL